MAYTILATWDFRTTTSLTGRTARRGGYVLDESSPAPDWSSGLGADCSGGNTRRLTLTLPTELKVSPVWWIAGMRLITGTTPADYTTILGLTKSSTGEYERALLLWRNASTTGLGCAYGGTIDDVNTGVTLSTGADITIAARRTGTSNPAFGVKVNSDAWDSGLVGGSPVDYTSTSQLVFGSLGAQNSYMRYHWFIMGDGAITDGEVDAILADPDAYIYGSGSTVAKSVFPFFLG